MWLVQCEHVFHAVKSPYVSVLFTICALCIQYSKKLPSSPRTRYLCILYRPRVSMYCVCYTATIGEDKKASLWLVNFSWPTVCCTQSQLCMLMFFYVYQCHVFDDSFIKTDANLFVGRSMYILDYHKHTYMVEKTSVNAWAWIDFVGWLHVSNSIIFVQFSFILYDFVANEFWNGSWSVTIMSWAITVINIVKGYNGVIHQACKGIC